MDFTGCSNLIQVHPSIGHLTKLVFLSLQNCSSFVNLDFGRVSNLNSLRILHLSGCTKLERMPDFTGASNLEYIDMDGCTNLLTVHDSIAALSKLRFLSLRDCTSLVGLPDSISSMSSLDTLDLSGCFKLTTLPLEWNFSSSPLESLIFIDVSFCNLHKVQDALGNLRCLERLNLQGNKFDSLPDLYALENLSYLNLSHFHELQTFPRLPLKITSSGGIYFKIASGSRDHRSGLYIFDCPKIMKKPENQSVESEYTWFLRLLQNPHHFRCGFDIVVPWDWKNIDFPSSGCIPKWFNHQFDGGSIVRIVDCYEDDKKFGFAFCVAFEVNNHHANAGSPQDSFSSPLPHPFYLSFENEHTEEHFDMPLSLELQKIDGSKHLWLIYISQEHCHFVKTGAHITFKACPGLIIKKWGLCRIIDEQMAHNPPSYWEHLTDMPQPVLDNVQETSSQSGPKIQLPYNWLVTEHEEVENSQVKSKEINLSNMGL